MSSSPKILQEAIRILDAVTGPHVQLLLIPRLWELISSVVAHSNVAGILPPFLRAISDRLGVLCVQLQMNLVSHRNLSENDPIVHNMMRLHEDYSSQEQLLQELREKYVQQYQMYQQQMEELLIMGCQVLQAAPEDNLSIGYLMNGIITAAGADVPIERAARYLSTKSLVHVSKALEDQGSSINPDAEREQQVFQKTKRAADTLLSIARKRTIQDLRVVSILQDVKGDARKVWILLKVPDYLKEQFHVPFEELYKKLKQENFWDKTLLEEGAEELAVSSSSSSHSRGWFPGIPHCSQAA